MKQLVVCTSVIVWACALLAGQGRGLGVPGKDIPQLSDEVLAKLLPETPGRDAVKRICGSECHTVEPVVAHSGDRDYWDRIAYDMTLQGAAFAGDEQEQIVTYLARHYPARIDVNAASAEVLETQLKFSAGEAAAIVAHRQKYGPLTSIEALRQVEGVSREKIDAVSGRLAFAAH